MIILTIRTDNPLAELGLYDDHEQLSYHKWQAHRQLSETIHSEMLKLLKANDLRWSDLEGVVFYSGPGSFTGLRIGASVANALSNSLSTLLTKTNGDNWIDEGIEDILNGKSTPAIPEYGAEPHITTPKK